MKTLVFSIFIQTFRSDIVVQMVVFVLGLMSFISWTVFFYKFFYFRGIRKREDEFYALIDGKATLKSIYHKKRVVRYSPFALFLDLYMDFGRNVRDKKSLIESAELIAQNELSRWLSALATIGNVAPFVGLFGTVWGIMKAFHMIGLRGSANLAVVAPGISEALVNTALGLFVAIPAVVFYNYFTGKMDSIINEFKAYALIFVEAYGDRDEEKTSF